MSFSIIICAYNPDGPIFQKLLNAVLNFCLSSPLHEVIIVDNNSTNPLEQSAATRSFIFLKPYTTIISEKKAGLTNARIAGIQRAKYDWVIFFDDDNEPAMDFLSEAKQLIEEYPVVGAWGPGNIKVNYVGQKENTYLCQLKPVFQQRQITEVCFDNNKVEGSECYPFGTGLIIRRDILNVYINEVAENKITMTDRKGDSFSSGGDTQMLYICLRMGFYAGACPSLKLIHNILPSKTRLRNLLKLIYNLHAVHVKAYNEVFAETTISVKPVSSKEICKNLYSHFRVKGFFPVKNNLLSITSLMGMYSARVLGGNFKKPTILKIFEKVIDHN